jgi:hypothetical protein
MSVINSQRRVQYQHHVCVCYRKPRRGLAHASDFCIKNPLELYVSKTQTVKVVLKSIWCSFCLKVQQRRAHDVSQVRRRPILYTGRRRERSG